MQRAMALTVKILYASMGHEGLAKNYIKLGGLSVKIPALLIKESGSR
jgi:hypothetical protein